MKGSGRTRFSRGGDGRAALGPVLREYVVSEAMAALGIPTTRALAAVTTGEMVYREPPQPGAIFARVAASHIRIGTFQYFAARGDREALKTLADYAIARHYPDAAARGYLAFLEAVVAAQARLVARWMLVGFIHGVMNTDNMSISGETIDYGPCAFMDAYHPGTVFSSIDAGGRYAYANQPRIAVVESLPGWPRRCCRCWPNTTTRRSRWPKMRCGSFRRPGRRLPCRPPAQAGAVHRAAGRYDAGRRPAGNDGGQRGGFHAGLPEPRRRSECAGWRGGTRSLFARPAEFDGWAKRWKDRLALEPEHDAGRQAAMRSVNPKFIPRNHRVEQVIRAAVDQSDFAPFEELLSVLAKPFDEQPEMAPMPDPPKMEERVLETFCGT